MNLDLFTRTRYVIDSSETAVVSYRGDFSEDETFTLREFIAELQSIQNKHDSYQDTLAKGTVTLYGRDHHDCNCQGVVLIEFPDVLTADELVALNKRKAMKTRNERWEAEQKMRDLLQKYPDLKREINNPKEESQ